VLRELRELELRVPHFKLPPFPQYEFPQYEFPQYEFPQYEFPQYEFPPYEFPQYAPQFAATVRDEAHSRSAVMRSAMVTESGRVDAISRRMCSVVSAPPSLKAV
jgi:hypothetical protein